MPTPNAPPDALSERFRRDLTVLLGGAPADRLALAVSGGPDSLALLLLAHASFPGHVEAATVDHRLRAESGAEAAFVASVCASLDVRHETLTIDPLPPGNVSANAREARYGALGGWMERRGLDWLLTAHHADDQLETMIMRFNRGSGVAGLAGVRRRQGVILRPLLRWRRGEMHAVVADAGLTPVEDPSNSDDRYDRARLRKALAGADWLDPLAASDAAATLAAADDALIWMADQLAAGLISSCVSGVTLDRDRVDLPPELLRRLVLRAMARVDPDFTTRGPELTRFVRSLDAGRPATLAGIAARPAADGWHFAPAPPRRAPV